MFTYLLPGTEYVAAFRNVVQVLRTASARECSHRYLCVAIESNANTDVSCEAGVCAYRGEG